MQVVGLPTWLERTIGAERDTLQIAAAIARTPEFLCLIRESVEFAQRNPVVGVDASRVIAEGISRRFLGLFDEFKTMH